MTKSYVTKVVSVILAVIVVVAALLIFIPNGKVEIQTTPGTKVFVKPPGGDEQFLNSVSTLGDGLITVKVPKNADIILRHDNNEEIFPYETWKVGKSISHVFPISVQIEADPWAYVFIKLPGDDHFIEPRPKDYILLPGPNNKHPNLTPIRGGLELPIGTAIKLVYKGIEEIFPYQKWKETGRVAHIFSNP